MRKVYILEKEKDYPEFMLNFNGLKCQIEIQEDLDFNSRLINILVAIDNVEDAKNIREIEEQVSGLNFTIIYSFFKENATSEDLEALERIVFPEDNQSKIKLGD